MRESTAFPREALSENSSCPGAGQPARAAMNGGSGCSGTAERRARHLQECSYCNHLSYTNYPTQRYSRVVLGQVPERSRTAVALVSMSYLRRGSVNSKQDFMKQRPEENWRWCGLPPHSEQEECLSQSHCAPEGLHHLVLVVCDVLGQTAGEDDTNQLEACDAKGNASHNTHF